MPEPGAAEKAMVRKLAKARTGLRDQLREIDKALTAAIRKAYAKGVPAIELSKMTGIGRQQIYERLRSGPTFKPHQPKKVKL